MRLWLRTLATLVAVMLLAWPAASQEVRGAIEGYVKDASGGVLPGVTVTLTGGAGAKIDTTSDGSGQYRFPSVQPGRYKVTANLSGFKASTVSDVDVTLGALKKVDFTLAIAGVAESVQVTPPQRAQVDVAVLTGAVMIHTAIIASVVLAV